MNTELFKTRLEEEKKKLTDELGSIAVTEKGSGDWNAVREEDPGTTGSSDEVADQLEDMSERKSAEVTLEKQLAKVNLALEKIENGKYGICEISGEPIEDDRLEANPSARTCKMHIDQEDSLPI